MWPTERQAFAIRERGPASATWAMRTCLAITAVTSAHRSPNPTTTVAVTTSAAKPGGEAPGRWASSALPSARHVVLGSVELHKQVPTPYACAACECVRGRPLPALIGSRPLNNKTAARPCHCDFSLQAPAISLGSHTADTSTPWTIPLPDVAPISILFPTMSTLLPPISHRTAGAVRVGC
jgi:hypothetical protein